MMREYLRLIRIRQWPKNVFVFSAVLFGAKQITGAMPLVIVAGYFFLFSVFSSAVYVFNDIIDIDYDKEHPKKKDRPLAKGAINKKQAVITIVVLLSLGVGLSFFFNLSSRIIVYGYLLINILYTLRLKNVPVIDISVVASGFLLRAIGGAVAVNLDITKWFLVCIFMLSLMIAALKRRSEYRNGGGYKRNVLTLYNKQILDIFVALSSGATLITYCIFSISHASFYMFVTIPIVLYGIMRYLYIAYTNIEQAESPDEYLFKDIHMIITGILFALTIGFSMLGVNL